MLALVTGSTGFLGSHLVQRLCAAGHRVRALVRTRSKAGILEAAGAEIADGDITNPASLAAAAAGIDVIFHAAANVTNWGPWSEFHAISVQGTLNLLDAAKRAGVGRFVHISTIRVYDDRYCRRHGIVTEEAPQGKRGFRHFGYYARAKVQAEEAVWRSSAEIPVTVIRPAWIYGPRDETILPPLLRYLRGPGAMWPSRSNPCADPIFVTDVADCAILAAQHSSAVGQAYNAAPHERTGVREFLGMFGRELNVRMPDRSTPYALAAAAAHVSEWWAWLLRRRTAPTITRAGIAILTQDVRHDPAKAERDFGWRSRVDLLEGVAHTVRWLRESHPELVQP